MNGTNHIHHQYSDTMNTISYDERVKQQVEQYRHPLQP